MGQRAASVQFSSVAQSCLTLRPHGLYPTRLLCPWGFPGNSIGVDCHFLLQGIFPTQRSNLGLPHCRQMLYRLSHQGRYFPKVLNCAQPLLCLPAGMKSWVGHKVHSGFAVTACLKNQTNSLANPVVYQRGSVWNMM